MTKKNDARNSRELREEVIAQITKGSLTIGQAVRAMRKTTSMNQRDYAKNILSIPVRTLSEIERDQANPTVETLNRVGRPFGLQAGFVSRRAESFTPRSQGSGIPTSVIDDASDDTSAAIVEGNAIPAFKPSPTTRSASTVHFESAPTLRRSPAELSEYIKNVVSKKRNEERNDVTDFLKRKNPHKDFRDKIVLLGDYVESQDFDDGASIQWLAGDEIYDAQIFENASGNHVLEQIQLTLTINQRFQSELDHATAELYEEEFDENAHLENFKRRLKMQTEYQGVMSGKEAGFTATPLLICAATRKFLKDYSSTDANAVLVIGLESLPPEGQPRTEFLETIEAVAWSMSYMKHTFDKISLLFWFGDSAGIMVPIDQAGMTPVQERLETHVDRLHNEPHDNDRSLDWGNNPSGAMSSGSNRWAFTLRGIGEHLFGENEVNITTLDDGSFYPEFRWPVPTIDPRTGKVDVRPGFTIKPEPHLLHRLAFSDSWEQDCKTLRNVVEAVVFRRYGELVQNSKMPPIQLQIGAHILDQ